MITVIPRKITATSVNGVAVANDGSITLPVDSAPTTNSTNLVTSGGVKTELDALSARIGNAENPAQVWTDVSFTIPTSSWSLSNNKYTATVQSSSILATSGVFVNYDNLDNAITPIIAEESTGQVTFTTETIPSGTITGTFRIIDSVNGIVPMERGGTGVAAASKDNLLTQLGAASTSALTTGLAGTRAAMGIVEDGNTATHTISAGQYVIWKGVLYTADAAIASGTTLAASGGNKNLTAVSGGGLNSLLSQFANQQSFDAQIYDSETATGISFTNAYYTKIGKLMFMWGNGIQSDITISSMFQIRNLPCSRVLGGGIHISSISDMGGDRTIQASNNAAYFRPNIKGNIIAGSSHSFWLIGQA